MRRIRGKLGEVTFPKSHTIRIPKSVVRFFLLKENDKLEFYPPETDFTPEETENNLFVVLIVRATMATTEMEVGL
jgi:hypothetical protein